MHTTRIALTLGASIAAAAVVTLVACSDTRSTPVAPATSDLIVSAPAARSAAARANSNPSTFRRIPDKHRWVGEEHNNLLDLGVSQFVSRREHDRPGFERTRRDCDAAYDAMRAGVAQTMARSGGGVDQKRALDLARSLSERSGACRGTGKSLSLFATPVELAAAFAPSSPASPPAASGDDIDDATIAALNAVADAIDAANSPAELDNAIASAGAYAAGLAPGQADFVWAVASIGAGSAGYWEAADQRIYAMRLFQDPTDWQRFKGFIGADAKGGAACLSALSKLPIPAQGKIGICGLVAAGASLFNFFK